MERCDVLVVGGGPGGSSLAWALRRSGRRVLVVDRARFPRDKVCAGWITPQVVETLQLDLADYGEARTLQSIHGFRIAVMGRRSGVVTRRSAAPISYGIRRCELDAYLLRRSGAELRLDEPVEDLRRDGSGQWVLNGSYRAPMLVGAGGHFCPVARHLGATLGGESPVIVAQEVELELPSAELDRCAVDATVPQLDFCPDLRGYGWVVRKGNFLNVGLGREDTKRLRRHVEGFREELVAAERIPQSTPGRFSGHAYHLYSHPPRRLFDDGVLLVGDAAGLAYSESGEGIRTAVESALLAAAVVVEADGGYGRDRLAAYGDRLRRRFGAQGARRSAGRFLPPPLRSPLAAALLGREWFARRIVADRWFLRRRQPALTPAGLAAGIVTEEGMQHAEDDPGGARRLSA